MASEEAIVLSSDHAAQTQGPRSVPVSRLKAWSVVAVLCALYAFSYIDRNLLSLLSVAVAKDLSLTDTQLGMLLGVAYSVCYAVVGLPAGWALDRFDRRLVIWAGVVTWSLATVACGFSRNFAALFAGRAAVGSGEAVLIPGSQSVLADIFPPERLALPLSIFGLGAKLGGGLSFIIGGLLTMLFPVNQIFAMPLIGPLKGWQLIFIVAGLPGLIISAAAFVIPRPERHISLRSGATRATYSDYFRFMKRNASFFIPHHSCIALLMTVVSATAAWTPAFFLRVHGWSMDQIGIWIGVALGIGPVVGIPFHGALSDKLFRRGQHDAHLRYLKLMLILATIPGAAMYLISSPWISLALLCISQTMVAAYIGIFPTTVQLVVPPQFRGMGGSIALLVAGLGGLAVGPSLVSLLTDLIFHDQNKIGLSLAICVGVLQPLAALSLALAQRPMSQRLTRAN